MNYYVNFKINLANLMLRENVHGLPANYYAGGEEGFVHSTAKVHPTAKLAPGVVVGKYAEIGANCQIGTGTIIGNESRVGADNVIGELTFLPRRTRVGQKNNIGDLVVFALRTEIGDGNVIGNYCVFGEKTLIENQVKIDESVSAAHDVVFGNKTYVASGEQVPTRFGHEGRRTAYQINNDLPAAGRR